MKSKVQREAPPPGELPPPNLGYFTSQDAAEGGFADTKAIFEWLPFKGELSA